MGDAASTTDSSGEAPAAGHTEGSLLFVGTATTLLRYAGFTLLTDPNFLHRGQRAYLGYGLTSKRLTEPALQVGDLPPIDVVALSHLHGDHFDRVAKKGLDREVPIVTTRQGARRLRPQGFRAARGLRTWEPWQVERPGKGVLRITALPGRHAPGALQALFPDVMGSLIEIEPTDGGRPLRVYVTGDTLARAELRSITRRFPDIDMAVVHLGGTRVLGVTLTMDGRQGADLLEILGIAERGGVRPTGPAVVPIHYDDYTLFRSPLDDFRAELDRRGLSVDVRWMARGDSLALPLTTGVSPTPAR
jgi:L-ascorbate metabolism protein UlaG (beta-lactamase superfamily)